MRAILISVLILAAGSARAQDESDPLHALSLLEGEWHGEGKSPYGDYEFDLTNERRGRWLLGTSNVYRPGTNDVIFTGTGIVGYDDEGIVMYSFELDGMVVFRGEPWEGGVRFEWRDGDSYRTRILKPIGDGTIANHEETYLPSVSAEKLVFDSVSKPGRRPAR